MQFQILMVTFLLYSFFFDLRFLLIISDEGHASSPIAGNFGHIIGVSVGQHSRGRVRFDFPFFSGFLDFDG